MGVDEYFNPTDKSYTRGETCQHYCCPLYLWSLKPGLDGTSNDEHYVKQPDFLNSLKNHRLWKDFIHPWPA